MKLTQTTIHALRCPACQSPLQSSTDTQLSCTDENCQSVFPVEDGIPVLINEQNSIFTIQDILARKNRYQSSKRYRQKLNDWLPSLNLNIHSQENYALLAKLLLERTDNPRVLIVGGGIIGSSMDKLLALSGVEFVETDIYLGQRVNLVCDAHDIPFQDSTFDGVIAQAVLEHVVDPNRCVAEIHRVLKLDGLVYAETPFMQQVHLGAYDFTRFSDLGHRRLFRHFKEVSRGAVCGSGMALAWSYYYFLLSLFNPVGLPRLLLFTFARLTGFWIKYFDRLIIDRPGTRDAASALFFLGRKSVDILSDRELIAQFRGLKID